MRGVLLAGGTGSRLLPMTRVTNKHLLPVFDRPMIYWPLYVLMQNGIRDVLVVSGREHLGDVVRLLGSGDEFRCRFTFRVQDRAGGIAEALALAEDFCSAQEGPWPFHTNVVILGDTILWPPPAIKPLPAGWGARVYLKEVSQNDAMGYGVALFDHAEPTRITHVEEKPSTPPHYPQAVTGLYVYDSTCFERVRRLRPSGRGELEITDVNNSYAAEHRLDWEVVQGYWGDAGTVGGMADAARTLQRLTLDAMLHGPTHQDWPPPPNPVAVPAKIDPSVPQ